MIEESIDEESLAETLGFEEKYDLVHETATPLHRSFVRESMDKSQIYGLLKCGYLLQTTRGTCSARYVLEF